jgi:hypothetical protein
MRPSRSSEHTWDNARRTGKSVSGSEPEGEGDSMQGGQKGLREGFSIYPPRTSHGGKGPTGAEKEGKGRSGKQTNRQTKPQASQTTQTAPRPQLQSQSQSQLHPHRPPTTTSTQPRSTSGTSFPTITTPYLPTLQIFPLIFPPPVRRLAQHHHRGTALRLEYPLPHSFPPPLSPHDVLSCPSSPLFIPFLLLPFPTISGFEEYQEQS